jgi:DNA-binding LacI/PurR family transcriptional regulator
MAVNRSSSSSARRIQQREIAERAGVSVSTVSRVLNNVAGISETVTQKVLAVAAELGYQQGDTQPANTLQNVFLLTSLPQAPLLDPFHAEVLSAVEQECGRAGLHFGYASVRNGAARIELVAERLRRNTVDGLLLLSIDDAGLIEQIGALGLPTIMINVDRPELAIDTFLPDNSQGALLAMNHLIAQGHQRILHVTWSERSTIRRRREAYESALAGAGLPYDPRLVVEAKMNADDTYQEMKRKLTEEKVDFTAAFCANDLGAMGFMRAAQEAGYRIPEDISVIGFDDIESAAYLSPPLTTVRIETVELAKLALKRLHDRVAAPELTPIRVSLACRLIERQSVARPRARL